MTLQLAVEQLMRPRTFGDGAITVEYRRGLVPSAMVSNVRVVPFTDDGRCVLVRSAEWGWMIPGGTREPGESPLETAVREMREETGGVLLSFRPIGADWCESSGPPYRPHLPHPKFCFVYGWGEIELDGDPEPVDGGETIVEVTPFRIDEAITLFLERGDQDAAAIVRLAAGDRAAYRPEAAL